MSIESVTPSNHLTLCHPLLLPPSIFPSIRVFSNESVLCIRWPKFWSFSFNISPSNEYSGLISFRMDWLDLLAVQGTLKSLLQHHRSKASILWRSAFFIVQLSHAYMTTGKTMAGSSRQAIEYDDNIKANIQRNISNMESELASSLQQEQFPWRASVFRALGLRILVTGPGSGPLRSCWARFRPAAERTFCLLYFPTIRDTEQEAHHRFIPGKVWSTQSSETGSVPPRSVLPGHPAHPDPGEESNQQQADRHSSWPEKACSEALTQGCVLSCSVVSKKKKKKTQRNDYHDCLPAASCLCHVRLCETPWTVAPRAPLSLGFSRREYWSGLPCPPPGDLPDPGIRPVSLISPALAGGFFSPGSTWEARLVWLMCIK